MFSNFKKETVVSVFEPVELPIIDNDELAIEFNVIDLAKESARNERPSITSKKPDANEINFRQKLDSKALQAKNKVNQSTHTLKNKISSLSISSEISEIKKIDDEYNKQTSLIANGYSSEISFQKKEYLSADDELNNFKKTNNIRRSAHYPESNALTFGILFVALIVEAIFNGIFFADGNDLGLLGGVIYASVLAFINITLGFLSGWWVFRYKNHNSQTKVYLFMFLFVILCFIDIAFNLSIAHFREALGIDPDNATAIAIKTWNEGVLNISDIESWQLFLIGLIFFSGAVYKGYTADDPYPEYGRYAKKRKQLVNAILENKENSIFQIEYVHDEYIKKLEMYHIKANKKMNQLNTFISSVEHQVKVFDSYISHLNSTLEYIITLYRDINSSERKELPPPYFNNDIDSLAEHPITITYIVSDTFTQDMNKISTAIPDIRGNMLSIKYKYISIIEEEALI